MRKPDWLFDAEPYIHLVIYGLILIVVGVTLFVRK